MKIRGGCIFQPRYTRNGQTRISQTYMIQYRVNGRLIRESAKTRDAKEANRLLVRRMAKAQEGKHTLPTRQTLAAFLGPYLEGQRHKGRACVGCGGQVHHLTTVIDLRAVARASYASRRGRRRPGSCTRMGNRQRKGRRWWRG